jgi:ubiquinone/menaquinone biosynthesis C-methylase UbiE
MSSDHDREFAGMNTMEDRAAHRTTGLVLHAAHGYDMLVWLLTLGRERSFRERMLDLARLRPGESVLDVGCGTGTLAIAARRKVGPAGAVYGIDASPEMIARAGHKASRAGIDVVFRKEAVQALSFPDARFDVVLSTLMFHHLPKPARRQCVLEIKRVLRPGGRVLIVDFGVPAKRPKGLASHFHRYGGIEPSNLIALPGEAGLTIADGGRLGMKDLHFVLATKPADATPNNQCGGRQS